MPVQLQREGDRVWLEGVTLWSPRERQSSVHAAQEATLLALGEEVDYDELLGVSGLAFRMQLSREGLCPSSPHAFCGYPCAERAVESLPWHVRLLECKPDEADRVREIRRAVTESIDRGVPVQYGGEEDGLIIGYREGTEEWICLHPIHGRDGRPFVERAWPWGFAIYTGRKEAPPDRRRLAREALRQAVTMATAGEAGGYVVGFDAWDAYIARLRGLDAAADVARSAAVLGNAWIYECLARHRGSAARYLRGIAGGFAPAAAASLLRAADAYEEIAGPILGAPDGGTAAVAPYPWMLAAPGAWDRELRERQAQRLERALPVERAAIDALRSALDSAGASP